MSEEQDKIFLKNFSLALGFIAAMMFVFVVVARFVGSDDEADAKARAGKVARLTEPVGRVTATGDEVAEVPEVVASVDADTPPGKVVYDGLCANCHGIPAMAVIIPQTGDAVAWKDRVAKGTDVLYDHAINGFTGELGMMPGRGGNPNLSDDEVKAAVDYMVQQVQ